MVNHHKVTKTQLMNTAIDLKPIEVESAKGDVYQIIRKDGFFLTKQFGEKFPRKFINTAELKLFLKRN